jgi:ankyrin repeat protein
MCLAACLMIPLAILAQTATDSANATGQTALHAAARTGNVAAIRSALEQGNKPDVRDREGRTPLMDAAASGHVDAAQLLIRGGAQVNAFSKAGRTALMDAAAGGHWKMTKLLIAAGADLNRAQRGHGTALQIAEQAGNNDIVALLLKAGAQSSGSSVGDKVCVRPWNGDGYCGTVTARNKSSVSLRVTELVGCKDGCAAKSECSEGRAVGGSGGISVGEPVTTVTWCLTHTGVKP